MKASRVLLFLAILNSTAVFAIPEGCDERGSTLGIYECWAARKIEMDALLNQQYADLRLRIQKTYKADASIGAAYAAAVKKSQIAWLGYRDANCSVKAFEIDVGTQAYEAEQNRCVAEISKSRAEELALMVR